jgi:hypothetical protein
MPLATEGTQEAWLELCRVATEEDESQMKEIKEITPSEYAKRSKISVISFISCVPTVASGKAERCGTLKKRLIQRNDYIIMKLLKNIPAEKIGNFILTVITAFVSTFLMQSCM